MPEIPAGGSFSLWVVILFLGASLLLYCLLAGADFGAGILEVFMGRGKRRAQRTIIDRALGPVWEANHMWLILMVVILFTGFPAVYSRVSTNLHLPLTAMLLGIIARGCSFTFRHYDAVKGRSQRSYSLFFIYSSVWTPFCLGVVTGALVPGGIDPAATGYLEGYVRPWLRPFPLALGGFTVCLFAFLAAVYLIGESPAGAVRSGFARRAVVASAVAVAVGGLVFWAAEADGIDLAARFLASPAAAACVVGATFSLPVLWLALAREWGWIARILAGGQVALILAAWFAVQFPILVKLKNAPDLTFFNSHAPEATLYQLNLALTFGAALILPALYFLFRVFKSESPAPDAH
ncbi:MAG TPA: cytochrome d ubiquinol oxidase subunit II [Fibrobacteria bacterium]|nr:cytochrome d ubiquinol oxidase subunit II [Fibrobacteria bacterium]